MRTLLEDITDFLVVHPEVTAAALGRSAIKDSYLVAQLREGRSPRETTVKRVRAWMADYTLKSREREAANREVRKRVNGMARAARGAGGPSSAPAAVDPQP